ncbi:hypothetical protein AAC387_Pa09g1494 [Persea americana]
MTSYFPLPPGFQFYPSHLELLKYYLQKKVLGEQLPSDAVIEGEVYGDDARLPEAGDIGDRELHMFVKIKKNQNGTKTKRMTKNGFWRVTGNKKEIKDESGIHIGTMRSLVFVEKCNSERKKKLLMDEYTLDGSLKKINSEGWVLCKIKQSNRSPESPNSQEEEEEEEEGDGLTSRPTASPALQGIGNRSSNLVIDDMECFDMDGIWVSMENNQAMAECPFEPAGGPSHMCPVQWFDQSLAMMGTPTLRPTEPPTLGGIDYNCENDDGWANMNNENFFNECLDYTYE